MRGNHHSPVLKETLKLASEKSNLAPCGPVAGHRQLKPNCFWEKCIRLWLLHFVPVSGDGCSSPSATTSWLGCARERSCKDILADRWFLRAPRGTLPAFPPQPGEQFYLLSPASELPSEFVPAIALCFLAASLGVCVPASRGPGPFLYLQGRFEVRSSFPCCACGQQTTSVMRSSY